MTSPPPATALDTAPRGAGETPRYAVVFRTHFWDGFTQRQFDRLSAQVGSGDVFVLVDATRGPVPNIGAERVFPLTDQQILDAGYVQAGTGSIQWFSGDVPLYLFFESHPDYDFYVQLEYDVNIHTNLDRLIADVARDGADFVALTKGRTGADWHFGDSCRGVYADGEIRNQLICLSVFSKFALEKLGRARLDQAERFRSGEIPSWPYCEAFLPTEAAKQGLKSAELSRYGDVGSYDWWPPVLEKDLPAHSKRTFVHPVLDRDKYVASLLKQGGLKQHLLPTSPVHRRLRRLGMRSYLAVLTGKPFREAVLRSARKTLRGGRS